MGCQDWFFRQLCLRHARVQSWHPRRAQERDRFSVCRMEQQGGWLRQLRRRSRGARRRALASRAGGGANGHRAQPGLALDVYRLRKLQRLQAGPDKGTVGQRDAGRADRVGSRAEDAAGETSIGR